MENTLREVIGIYNTLHYLNNDELINLKMEDEERKRRGRKRRKRKKGKR